MSRGSGFFQHGHTYLGHPVACAAALAVQRVIRRDGLLDKVRTDGEAFGQMLAQALGRSEEHTSELQSQSNLVCRLLLEKKKTNRLIASGDADRPTASDPRSP